MTTKFDLQMQETESFDGCLKHSVAAHIREWLQFDTNILTNQGWQINDQKYHEIRNTWDSWINTRSFQFTNRACRSCLPSDYEAIDGVMCLDQVTVYLHRLQKTPSLPITPPAWLKRK